MKNIKSLKFWLVVLVAVLVASFVFFCTQAKAQTWYTANQVTVGWNPVAKIDATDTIKYQVYLRIGTTGDGAPYGLETEATQMLITFSAEGSWFVGVKSLRYKTGEPIAIPSATVSWSNDAGVTDNVPFGIKYLVAPSSPVGLHRVP
jgi:hypothetical protein